jgi:SsrA-binding protein
MGKKKKKTELAASGERLVCQNRKAFHDYAIGERFEAGLMLVGTEVKACREGNAHLNEAFVQIIAGEAYLEHSYIGEYRQGNQFNHETSRSRKLLLHGREIEKLWIKIREKGFTVVPISLYFKNGRLKVEIALAKGKDREDKRETLKARTAKREMDKVTRSLKRR